MIKFDKNNKYVSEDGKIFIYRKAGKRWVLIIDSFGLSVCLNLKTELICKTVATLLAQ